MVSPVNVASSLESESEPPKASEKALSRAEAGFCPTQSPSG